MAGAALGTATLRGQASPPTAPSESPEGSRQATHSSGAAIAPDPHQTGTQGTRPSDVQVEPPRQQPRSALATIVPERARSSRQLLQPLSYEDLEYIHLTLVDDFVRSPDPIEPPGIRDPHLLHSALARLTTSFEGRSKYKTLEGLAASLFYGICQNHAFHNGNKRTAVVALLCYLDRNGYSLETTEAELYTLVTRLAAHTLVDNSTGPDDEIACVRSWIKPRMRQIARGEQLLRFRDLRSILVAFGCGLEPPSEGYITVRLNLAAPRSSVTRPRKATNESLRCKIPYHGETKEVDRGYIAKVRKQLKLDESHGYDSEIFYRAALRPDEFIVRYKVLLRRLAHV
jgi:death-on-curing family protein